MRKKHLFRRLLPAAALTLGLAAPPAAGFPPSPPGAAAQAFPTAVMADSAAARLERGDLDGARRLYQELLERDGDNADALIGMGRVFLADRAGAERALEYLRRATARHPTNVQAHYFRALAHLRLARTDLGRDNANFARMELETVLALDPSHSDALFRLGQLLRDVYGDGQGAVRAFRSQVAANPGHLQARLELVRALMDVGEWQEAIEQADALLARDGSFLDAYPYLAAANWKRGKAQEAMEVFERYFARIDEKEMGLYLDLGLVLTPTEQKELERLPSDGVRAYWARYWRTRDPDPKTDVNERLLEHYIRIAYARIEFGEQQWPWDARGGFYVRYGEPAYRSSRGRPVAWALLDDDPRLLEKKRDFQEQLGISSDFLQTSMFDNPIWDPPPGVDKGRVVELAASLLVEDRTLTPQQAWETASRMAEEEATSAVATPERWVYPDRGIDLHFEDPTHSGRYLATDTRSRLIIERMEKVVPTISEEEEKIDLIDPMDSVVTFRGRDGDTVVEYAFALLPEEFGTFRSVTGTYATIDVEVMLYTESWEPVAEAGQKRRRLQTIPQVKIRGVPLFVDATRMEVAPGTYRLTTLLLDPVTGKRATAEEIVDLPDYSGNTLMVSDILPAARITEVDEGREGRFIRGNLEVLPLPGRALQQDQPLFIYYEIYNLSKDAIGATDYQIEYAIAEAPQEQALASRLFQGLQRLVGRGRKRAVLTSAVQRSGIFSDESAYLEIDLSRLPAGTYLLELTITDKLNGATARGALLFRTLPIR